MPTDPTPDRPPPGSDAAIDRGCTCPVRDNARGRGLLLDGQPVYWIAEDCPLHQTKPATEDDR